MKERPKTKKNQLFLLHFAGGNRYSFDFLVKEINGDIECIALELPGRGDRFKEKLLRSSEEAKEDFLCQILKNRNGLPFTIFGHSMGAILAFLLTKELELLNDAPSHLIVSGNSGPRTRRDKVLYKYKLNDFEFKHELIKLGGIPTEILENDEIFSLFVKIMRADFECGENRLFSKSDIINTPIHAIMGTEEKDYINIGRWKEFTHANFNQTILKGGHFYIYQNKRNIIEIIENCFFKAKENLN